MLWHINMGGGYYIFLNDKGDEYIFVKTMSEVSVIYQASFGYIPLLTRLVQIICT